MAKRHKVAVYGTLMAGERNARWAADALDRRPCTLRGTLYDTGRGYPAFVPDDAGGEVRAELLTVTGATLDLLDGLEGFPWLYGHRKVLRLAGIQQEELTGRREGQDRLVLPLSPFWL